MKRKYIDLITKLIVFLIGILFGYLIITNFKSIIITLTIGAGLFTFWVVYKVFKSYSNNIK